MLLLASLLKRYGENLGKRQLDEGENNGKWTSWESPWCGQAWPCFHKLCFGPGKGCFGGSHSCGPSAGPLLRIHSVFLKFLLQPECLMCQQVTVCVSLWADGPMGRMMSAVTSMLPSFPDMPFLRTVKGQSVDTATGCNFVLLRFPQLKRSVSCKVASLV